VESRDWLESRDWVESRDLEDSRDLGTHIALNLYFDETLMR